MFTAMWKIIVFITVFIVVIGILPAASQLPCDSQLRTIRPDLFKHCSTCSYSQWSSWKIIDKALSSSCASGKTFKQIRTRHDLRSSCDQQNETQFTCKNDYVYNYSVIYMHPTLSLGQPTTQEKAKLFIKSLDLGLTAIPRPSIIIPAIIALDVIPINKTVSLTRKKRTIPDYCPSTVQKICSNTQSKELAKQYF